MGWTSAAEGSWSLSNVSALKKAKRASDRIQFDLIYNLTQADGAFAYSDALAKKEFNEQTGPDRLGQPNGTLESFENSTLPRREEGLAAPGLESNSSGGLFGNLSVLYQ
jgi:hypothetical protein